MHNQHNPIAQRVDEMRVVWEKKVNTESVLVRWLLKPEESRMYEGFCRLESSRYGSLPELFVFFYTPFEDPATYSRHLIANWIHEVRTSNEDKEQMRQSGIDLNNLDLNKYEQRIQQEKNVNCDQLLIDLMDSFRKLKEQDDLPLVLSLLPKQMNSIGGFAKWLHQLMQHKIPRHLRLLVLDHSGGNYLGGIFEEYSNKAVTLSHDLRLDQAIRQIATGGDSHNPEVQFRKCMYQMGDAAQKKDSAQLHLWGKKAINVGTKSGHKNLLATAYITYAGMLFNFKEHKAIQALLDSGIRISKSEIAMGNESLKPLLLQFYGFKAAAYQLQKETKQAFEWFMMQGKEAYNFGLFAQSISACHKAFLLAHYKNLVEEQVASLTTALMNTPYLHNDEIKSTEYPYLAYEYCNLVHHRTPGSDIEKATLADQRMNEALGFNWQKKVEAMKQNFNRQHINQTEAKATVKI